MLQHHLSTDGLNINFYQLLWSKDASPSSSSSTTEDVTPNSPAQSPPPIRVPDTVVFQYGQPLYWYFTSKRGGKDGKTVQILRKRKQNVTIEKIEELFLKKASTRGVLGDHDVVAYFIASADCTSRFRRRQSCGGDDNGCGGHDEGTANTNHQEEVDETTCDIEYFDREGLKTFLANGRKNQTGILQRFMQPTGGGTHNALIQAIWTPNLCLMERRRTKQSLHDGRFGLYERTVTFEGPDVHSTSKPIRGTVLGNKIKHLCNEMVHHVSEVTGAGAAGRKRSRGGSRSRNAPTALPAGPTAGQLSRMVVYFKVDINDDIWVLFTSSLRINDGAEDGGAGGGQNTLQLQPLLHSLSGNTTNNNAPAAGPMPLNINSIVKLGPNIKLNLNANHDPNKILDNEIVLSYCPSCGLDVSNEHFYPVPYKTIISHFEHAVEMMKDELGLERLIEWPPDKQMIEAAGGVGFGSYQRTKIATSHDGSISASASNGKAVSELPEEDTVIPPVIRQIHGRLKVQGYRRYRNDPLFLHKNCNVCEQCFLSYAQLASTSFQMINPVRIDEDERRERLADRRRRRNNNGDDEEEWSDEDEVDDQTDDGDFGFTGHFDSARIHHGDTTAAKSIGMLLSDAPSLPPVILEPPKDCENDHEGGIGHANTYAPSHSHPPAPLEAINMDDFLAKHMAPPHHSYRQSSDPAHHPLQHLISSYEMMEGAKLGAASTMGAGSSAQASATTQPAPATRRRRNQNPYEEPQRIFDPRPKVSNSSARDTKSTKGKKKSTDESNRKEGIAACVGGSPIQSRSTETECEGARRDEASSNDSGQSQQPRSSVLKLSAEDKHLLTSALSEIYDKQRELTMSQSELLVPELL